MTTTSEQDPALDQAVRFMRDAARWGNIEGTMKFLRRVEAISGASLAMRPDLHTVDDKIKSLKGCFWSIGSQTLPGGHWDWDDPLMVFCCQVISLVRAASSSGNVALLEALDRHGVDVGAMGWTMVAGPAVMQRNAELLEWAMEKGADPTGRAKSYDTTLMINKWSDMDQAPLLLACERKWKQGVAIMMGERCEPKDFWARGKGRREGQVREQWLVTAAGDADMGRWLMGRHQGHISSTMEQRIKSEIQAKSDEAGLGHWSQAENLRAGLEAMLCRQRLNEGVPSQDDLQIGEPKAKPPLRM